MHIHFITHVTTPKELQQLPCFTAALQQHFPDSELHVFNQTLSPIAGSIVCENIKACGFGWTLRFLKDIIGLMKPGEALIKVDPDIQIFGNPLEGVEIPEGAFFGQSLELDCCNGVFSGGFQGYTYEAVKTMLFYGVQFENETGPQDRVAHRVLSAAGMEVLCLPDIGLWVECDSPVGTLKIRHEKRSCAGGK